MNGYIIDPSWFYWVSVFEALKVVCVILGVMFIIATMIHLNEEGFDWGGVLLIFFTLVCAAGAIFIPNRQTMYEMMIAKHATYENANLTVEAIKSAVDYIVEKIGALR